jgi:hypothetical protein
VLFQTLAARHVARAIGSLSRARLDDAPSTASRPRRRMKS